jgi:hypothetical protein
MAINLENEITLQDGRKLGYAECGDRSRYPTFYSHGIPNSRLISSSCRQYLPVRQNASSAFSYGKYRPDQPIYGLKGAVAVSDSAFIGC